MQGDAATRDGKRLPPNAGKGRKRGVPNKITGDLKAMIAGALEGAGGQEYLTRQAKKNPNAFLALLGKTLPKDLNLGANVSLVVNLVGKESRGTDG